ncbi:glycosyltransferase family 2 protein [Botrimarina hoheduenensis]|uniref:Glycosyl transferase family 2 n=1 Tax=Botrimarina hoheduenensis TaxID=2528000 RepID=A0A5C5W9B3_9BACT|nr:glycosyltransferase [Botrimarina hoheduenensis]TWT47466.1 Glycosyl transferase family 2 [Botrimarina hoheduenensis]
MSDPIATIGFVPREVFSTTQRSLEALYERTAEPFNLVCIDGASPPEVANYLRAAATEKGFTLLRTDRYVTPNEARNLAARWALENTPDKPIVFVDNDVLVSPGWLGAMVDCANETEAWLVGPAYYEHLPEEHKLHMYGGVCRIEVDADGRRRYLEKHSLQHQTADQIDEPLKRQKTELIEYHTVLVSLEVFRQTGLLDEGLLCHAEHGDLCLTVREAGGEVWLEPEARITYAPPRRLSEADAEFFFLRWSEAWMRANQQHMAEKWRLDTTDQDRGRGLQWVAEHRRLGLNSLRTLRKAIGKKLSRSVEKRVVAPLERISNRRRYPYKKYANLPPVSVELVHQPGTARLVA